MRTDGACDPLLRALATGRLDDAGRRFAAAHPALQVTMPAPGMLQLLHADAPARPVRDRLLISVGVHGNETAPIEMMAQVLAALLDSSPLGAAAPAQDLLLVVGNPAAIAAAARFIDADLNRLFGAERGALAAAAEAARADAIMQASQRFLAGAPAGERWHLDLHSAIRPSRHARFAVIPAAAGDAAQTPLIDWLGSAGIEAVMFNSGRASTFSAFTARSCGALSCTVELGQVGVLGHNPPDQLLQTRAALLRLLRGQPAVTAAQPIRFRVAQEIIKRSAAFRLALDGDIDNFTALAPHALIATDGEILHRVGAQTEYIVFPNPRVLVGQRAGLMVVREAAPQADAGGPGEAR